MIRSTLAIVTFMLSSLAYAQSDCSQDVQRAFQQDNPRFKVKSVKAIGEELAPGEDRPYFQGEIWNDTNQPLDVYEIKTFFMADYTYVALVDDYCEVINFIQVGFDE